LNRHFLNETARFFGWQITVFQCKIENYAEKLKGILKFYKKQQNLVIKKNSNILIFYCAILHG